MMDTTLQQFQLFEHPWEAVKLPRREFEGGEDEGKGLLHGLQHQDQVDMEHLNH